MRQLVIVLGDQLDLEASAFDGFDAAQDAVSVHEPMLAKNPRAVMQVKNLARVDADERQRIAERAAAIRVGEVA